MASFSARQELQFFEKVNQNRTNLQNKQTTIILDPNFTKSERKVRLGQFFLKMIFLIS